MHSIIRGYIHRVMDTMERELPQLGRRAGSRRVQLPVIQPPPEIVAHEGAATGARSENVMEPPYEPDDIPTYDEWLRKLFEYTAKHERFNAAVDDDGNAVYIDTDEAAYIRNLEDALIRYRNRNIADPHVAAVSPVLDYVRLLHFERPPLLRPTARRPPSLFTPREQERIRRDLEDALIPYDADLSTESNLLAAFNSAKVAQDDIEREQTALRNAEYQYSIAELAKSFRDNYTREYMLERVQELARIQARSSDEEVESVALAHALYDASIERRSEVYKNDFDSHMVVLAAHRSIYERYQDLIRRYSDRLRRRLGVLVPNLTPINDLIVYNVDAVDAALNDDIFNFDDEVEDNEYVNPEMREVPQDVIQQQEAVLNDNIAAIEEALPPFDNDQIIDLLQGLAPRQRIPSIFTQFGTVLIGRRYTNNLEERGQMFDLIGGQRVRISAYQILELLDPTVIRSDPSRILEHVRLDITLEHHFASSGGMRNVPNHVRRLRERLSSILATSYRGVTLLEFRERFIRDFVDGANRAGSSNLLDADTIDGLPADNWLLSLLFNLTLRVSNPNVYGWDVSEKRGSGAVILHMNVNKKPFVLSCRVSPSQDTLRSNRTKANNCLLHSLNMVLASRLSYFFDEGWIKQSTWCNKLRNRYGLPPDIPLSEELFMTLYHMYKNLEYPSTPPPFSQYGYHSGITTVLQSRPNPPCFLRKGRTLVLDAELAAILEGWTTGLHDIVLCYDGHMAVVQSIELYEGPSTQGKHCPLEISGMNLTMPTGGAVEVTPVEEEATGLPTTFLYYDFETYVLRTSYDQDQHALPLAPTILHYAYREHGTNTIIHRYFTTFKEGEHYVCAARQFLDFLRSCGPNDKFTLVAHNAASFDHYMLLQAMTDEELDHVYKNGILRSGSSLIQFRFFGHKFIDSCKFLTASLASVCAAFLPRNPEMWKTKTVQFYEDVEGDPITMSSSQLCFYKNVDGTTFDEFIGLANQRLPPGRPTFFETYHHYCKQDVIALMHVWEAYNTAVDSLLELFAAKAPMFEGQLVCDTIKAKGGLIGALTTGNHHMRILKALNVNNTQWLLANWAIPQDYNMATLVNMYKTGGMSISHRRGAFIQKLTAFDIKSLYPYSLMYGLYPGGYPHYIYRDHEDKLPKDFDERAPGIYFVSDLQFRPIPEHFSFPGYSGEGLYTYRPILEYDPVIREELVKNLMLSPGERTWCSRVDRVGCTYVSSVGLEFLRKKMGLKHFRIEYGVQWEHYLHGSSLFGNHIESCYAIKQAEDDKKAKNDTTYNPALREAVKLGMNSLTGKLGQDPVNAKEFKMAPDEDRYNPLPKANPNTLTVVEDEKVNNNRGALTVHLVFLYEHSKIVMFCYLLKLIHGFRDLIAIETDSIHTFECFQEEFEANINNSTGGFVLQINNKYTHNLSLKCAPFAHTSGSIIPPRPDARRELVEKYMFVDLHPNMSAGADVSKLGALAVDKLAVSGIYISKKKYALFDGHKWLYRMSGLKPRKTEADGTVTETITTETFTELLRKSLQFTKAACDTADADMFSLAFDTDPDEIPTPRNRNYAYPCASTLALALLQPLKRQFLLTQKTSHLSKDPSIHAIYQTQVTKSVSPVLGVEYFTDNPTYENFSVNDIIEYFNKLGKK